MYSRGLKTRIRNEAYFERRLDSLVLEKEIASLARLEQRVAYWRTKHAYDYELLLDSACSEKQSTEDRLGSAEEANETTEEAKATTEKERYEVRVEVKKVLRCAKKKKAVKKLNDRI
ncbi:unnamed protein product [Cochlearia groenlandica]